MKQYFSLLLLCLLLLSSTAQSVEIDGSLSITNSNELPIPGTLRWTGSDFEGWTGSEWVSLTAGNKVQDGSGNSYSTVKIGNQIWLDENLRTTKYNDGSDIPLAEDVTDWQSFTNGQSPGMCFYDDDRSANEFPYGALYNFYSIDTLVNGNKNVCPVGFHVPDQAELDSLKSELDAIASAGGLLKIPGTTYWDSPNTDANNAVGFDAYPAGRRGPSGTFAGKGRNNYLRSISEVNSTPNAFYGLLSYDNADFIVQTWNRGIGMSVRCLRD